MSRRVWVLAYDISDDALRLRVQHALERVGERRQKSVFECRLNPAEMEFVWAELGALIDPTCDSVLAWPLTRTGHAQSRALGVAGVSSWDEDSFLIIGPPDA